MIPFKEKTEDACRKSMVQIAVTKTRDQRGNLECTRRTLKKNHTGAARILKQMEVRGHRLKGNKKKKKRKLEQPMGQLKEGRRGLVMVQDGGDATERPRGAHTKTLEREKGARGKEFSE